MWLPTAATQGLCSYNCICGLAGGWWLTWPQWCVNAGVWNVPKGYRSAHHCGAGLKRENLGQQDTWMTRDLTFILMRRTFTLCSGRRKQSCFPAQLLLPFVDLSIFRLFLSVHQRRTYKALCNTQSNTNSYTSTVAYHSALTQLSDPPSRLALRPTYPVCVKCVGIQHCCACERGG